MVRRLGWASDAVEEPCQMWVLSDPIINVCSQASSWPTNSAHARDSLNCHLSFFQKKTHQQGCTNGGRKALHKIFSSSSRSIIARIDIFETLHDSPSPTDDSSHNLVVANMNFSSKKRPRDTVWNPRLHVKAFVFQERNGT